MEIIRTGIYGASGFAGQNLVEILKDHPNVELVFASSNTYAGQQVTGTDLRYIPTDEIKLDAVDAVFLGLPHKTAATIGKQAVDAGKRVIDLSADMRFDSAEEYEKWYDIKHPHPDMLHICALMDLPEIHRDDIAGADNRWCSRMLSNSNIVRTYIPC